MNAGRRTIFSSELPSRPCSSRSRLNFPLLTLSPSVLPFFLRPPLATLAPRRIPFFFWTKRADPPFENHTLQHITLSRGAKILADTKFETLTAEHKADFDAVVVPGGAKGAERLSRDDGVKTYLWESFEVSSGINRLFFFFF